MSECTVQNSINTYMLYTWIMLTLWHGIIFCLTGPLRREFIWWIHLTKASYASTWCSLQIDLHELLNKQSVRRWFETPRPWTPQFLKAVARGDTRAFVKSIVVGTFAWIRSLFDLPKDDTYLSSMILMITKTSTMVTSKDTPGPVEIMVTISHSPQELTSSISHSCTEYVI